MQQAIITQLADLVNKLLANASLFIGLAKAIGGLGALFYVFNRVWGHLIRNEPIDIYPLFRPIAIALVLLSYSAIIGAVQVIQDSLEKSTSGFMVSQASEVKRLTLVKQGKVAEKLKSRTLGLMDTDNDQQVDFMELVSALFSPSKSTQFASDMIDSTLQSWADKLLSMIGEILYMIAFVLLKFLVSFFILIMLLTGPITIGLATFEWFYSGLASWVGRLLNLMMWIPITNLLGGMLEAMHVAMLKRDIANLDDVTASFFTADNFSLVVFYIIGTVAYMTVPMTAGWIVEASGAGDAISRTLKGATSAGGVAGGFGGMGLGAGKSAYNGARQAQKWNESLTKVSNKI